jgi:hypothetical protein
MVWPQSRAVQWRAEITSTGQLEPRRFERPMELLLYLTQLPGVTTPANGLR